ncbi:hypothetical protein [Niveispirillum sp.]|uniref:hypothetical protein n=1 Tax=Niveispirillum sp. TaxID=1917217 RepID=UPI001B53CD84|nr:hypothetical protein [Niveispirillum sp.]MBP7339998.1 hypothetical protein [Niveispirillum sp.]
MRRSLVPFALATLLVTAIPAVSAQPVPPPVSDTVSLNLSAEEWVKTETALVTLVVDIAGNGNSGTVRNDVLKAVAGVADRIEWRITALNPQSDSAGLERWQALLQARLPESQLASLGDRAKKASKPGQQVRVDSIAFDPTLAEMEATRGALRDKIYTQVNAELKRLNAAFPDRTYRVGKIEFGDVGSVAVQAYRKSEMMVAAAPQMADAMPGVQDKLVMNARITLAVFAAP